MENDALDAMLLNSVLALSTKKLIANFAGVAWLDVFFTVTGVVYFLLLIDENTRLDVNKQS